MNRSRALKHQRKLIVTVAVASVTVLLTLVYAVAAPVSKPGNQRAEPVLAAKTSLHEVDHSLHAIHSSGPRARNKDVQSSQERANAQALVVIEERVEEETSANLWAEESKLPQSSELLAGLASSKSTRVPVTAHRGGVRTGIAQRGGAASGGLSVGFRGSIGGGSASGVGAPRSFATEPQFGEVDLASAAFTGDGDTSVLPVIPLSKFRPGAPLPIGFDPCLRDGLVVSPCVRTSSELLEGLGSPDFSPLSGGFGDVPQPRIALLFSPPGQTGGGGGSGTDGGTDGGSGGESGGGSGDDPSNSGGNGGGDGFYAEDSATPVPAPAPVFLLCGGLMLLISRRRV